MTATNEVRRLRDGAKETNWIQSLGDTDVSLLAYYLAFGLYSLSCFLNGTTFETVFGVAVGTFSDVLRVVVLVLLASKFLCQRASFRGWVFASSVIAIGFVSWRVSSEGFLFWLALFVISAERVNLKCLAGISLGVTSAMLLLTLLFAGAGIIENRVSVRDGVTRYAMGFLHPNSFGAQLLLICSAIAVLRFGKSPLPVIPLFIGAAVLNNYLANSRTTVMLCILLGALLILFYVVRSPSIQRRLSIALFCFVAIIVLLSLYMMVNFDASSSIQAAMNDALSGRFKWAHAYYQLQPLTLFGSNFEQFAPIYWSNGVPSTFVVDNAYAHLVLRFGIVPSTLFFTGYIALFLNLIKQQRWDYVLFGVVLMAVFGFTEVAGIQVECNYFLVAIGTDLIFTFKDIHSNRQRARNNELHANN